MLKSYLLCSVRGCPFPRNISWSWGPLCMAVGLKTFQVWLNQIESHCGESLEVKGEKKRVFTVLFAVPVALGKMAFCPPGHSTGGLCWGKAAQASSTQVAFSSPEQPLGSSLWGIHSLTLAWRNSIKARLWTEQATGKTAAATHQITLHYQNVQEFVQKKNSC